MTPRPTGLIVLRVWIEEGSSEPLRVHVRQTHDLSRGFRSSRTLADVDEVMATIRAFLETSGAVDGPGGDGDDGMGG